MINDVTEKTGRVEIKKCTVCYMGKDMETGGECKRCFSKITTHHMVMDGDDLCPNCFEGKMKDMTSDCPICGGDGRIMSLDVFKTGKSNIDPFTPF